MGKTTSEQILEKLITLGFSPEVISHEPVITIDDVVKTLNIPVESMAKTILFSQKEIGLVLLDLKPYQDKMRGHDLLAASQACGCRRSRSIY